MRLIDDLTIITDENKMVGKTIKNVVFHEDYSYDGGMIIVFTDNSIGIVGSRICNPPYGEEIELYLKNNIYPHIWSKFYDTYDDPCWNSVVSVLISNGIMVEDN